MSDIQQFLLDYDRNKREATQVAQKSATRTVKPKPAGGARLTTVGLTNGDLKLLTLIEELGEYFNNEDGAIRAKGR